MSGDNVSFSIQVRMKRRWVPHFLSMLKYMEQLGNLGGSREVGIYSDGDGDFRPKFGWESDLLDGIVDPVRDEDGNRLYDAG